MKHFSPAFNVDENMKNTINAIRPEAIGPRIKSVRLARGYRYQKDVYEPLGLHSSNYSEYETGLRMPTISALYMIARFLHCPIDYFLDGSDYAMPDDLKVKLGLI